MLDICDTPNPIRARTPITTTHFHHVDLREGFRRTGLFIDANLDKLLLVTMLSSHGRLSSWQSPGLSKRTPNLRRALSASANGAAISRRRPARPGSGASLPRR